MGDTIKAKLFDPDLDMSLPTDPAQDPIDSADIYSKPATGLFCLLGAGGSIVANAEGQACCFESEEAAREFLQAHPELSEQLDIQEVVVKGAVHGWERVPADTVENRSLNEVE